MDITSRQVATIAHGVHLETTLDGERIDAYVVIGAPDLEMVADIVPRDKAEAGADIHVAAVDAVDTAQEQVDQVLENVNPADVVVFLCADEDAYNAALDLLGVPLD
ncbi:hypothetical protein CAL18_08665 [Bordetella genomosp. 7]|jgi:hypothetical protein|uniref:Uncharacterized protein n=1 Tax=Bordetella genomosp. 7 TaxID=1416805 RepID=A0A261RDV6_9BORD|nr:MULTISPECIES: hypothetical protein [Bordetella]OZI22862.1 hypothetical protein CAL19_10195 [Bordetella genomosp. 7]OZI25660.1 hypothetical protein CAL18_08665 [Bordetella genomosp. 7]